MFKTKFHINVVLALAVLITQVTTVLAAPIEQPAEAAAPGWIVSCQYSHSLPDDPIVSFRQPGVSHMHDFVGAKTTDAFSTSATLVAGTSTCAMPADESAYWVPALFKNGVRILPNGGAKHALFYYRRKGAPTGTNVQPFPMGLRMIIGNSKAKSAAENPQLGKDIIFKCGPGSTTDLPAPPTQCSSGILVVSLRFPNCWDGKNLDSPDHKSHMAYPSGSRCPASHPVVLPRIESFFRYNVGTGPIGTITFSSGPYYTAHQDFFNAWDPAVLQKLVTNCMNAMVDCGTNPSVSGMSSPALMATGLATNTAIPTKTPTKVPTNTPLPLPTNTLAPTFTAEPPPTDVPTEVPTEVPPTAELTQPAP